MASKKQTLKAERDARYQLALDSAYQAANNAQKGMVEDMNAMDCGFAWVEVHDPSFQRWCRTNAKRCLDKAKESANGSAAYSAWMQSARRYGSHGTYRGWQFWNPGDFNGQAIGIHEAGAKAFSEELSRCLGIRCVASSRLD